MKYSWAHGHEPFDVNFRTRTPKPSNQNTLFIGCDVLIGCCVELHNTGQRPCVGKFSCTSFFVFIATVNVIKLQ